LPSEATTDPIDGCAGTVNGGFFKYLAPLIAEFYGTFIFTSVILVVKSGLGVSEMLPLNALAIAGTLYNVCGMTGGISGAAINPAIGIAQTVWQNLAYGGSTAQIAKAFDSVDAFYGFTSIWFYIVGPLLGGAAAGILIQFTKAMGDSQDAT
jgi:glycerol uptake facilitator-like aquaporin